MNLRALSKLVKLKIALIWYYVKLPIDKSILLFYNKINEILNLKIQPEPTLLSASKMHEGFQVLGSLDISKSLLSIRLLNHLRWYIRNRVFLHISICSESFEFSFLFFPAASIVVWADEVAQSKGRFSMICDYWIS